MSAHVLLNLLNELGKRDEMRGLSSILYLFRKELNKFNKTYTPCMRVWIGGSGIHYSLKI